MTSGRKLSSRNSAQWLRAGGLVPFIALSAMLTAASLGSPGKSWLAWGCLIPLIAAARILPPLMAGLAGAAWGLIFYAATQASPTPVFFAGPMASALLAVVFFSFCLTASLATRAVGFAPPILALLWILAETALQPLGLRGGLVAGTQGNDSLLMRLAGLIGYVFVAAVIVYTNALLFNLVSRLRLAPLTEPALAALAHADRCVIARATVPAWMLFFAQGYPRAPPLP